jgi:hypothetical protein
MNSAGLSTYLLLSLTAGLGSWVLHDALDGAPNPDRLTAGQPPGSGQPDAINLTLATPNSRDAPRDGTTTRSGDTGNPNVREPLSTMLRFPVPNPGPGSSRPAHVTATASSHGPATSKKSHAVSGGHQGSSSYAEAIPLLLSALAKHSPAPRHSQSGSDASPGSSGSHEGRSYQILATQGSIVYVGSDGSLTANTGPVDSSAVLALQVSGSKLETGTSTTAQTSAPSPAGARSAATASSPAAPRSAAPPSPAHSAASPPSATGNLGLLGLLAPGAAGGRSVVLSGYEDHSVSVGGNDQIVTYDDSNVFVARNGQINANTGDTDSSGLNAVDVTGSVVRSGNSGDGEGDSEDDDEAESEGAAASLLTRPLAAIAADDDDDAAVGGAEDDEGSQNDEVDAFPVLPPGFSYGTVTDEGASSAIGRDTYVIGADGYDDVSIRTQGDRNIVSYDDSNVVIGGTGDVNAQIGDSDTGGAVVMGVHNSDVRAGCEGDLCYPRSR